jgi:malonyl-CoA O-methyltransferase
MADAAPPRSTLRALDGVALLRVRQRLQRGEAPWLHREVARRMADRLPVIRVQPRTVIDWWHGSGGSGEWLRRAYPRARRLPVRPDDAAPGPAPPWWKPARRLGLAETRASDLAPAAGELLWANMMLHWCADPHREMRRWHRALSPEGFLMFSTLGPGTLDGLRALYAAQGWPQPHAPFVDMHDLGDMLVAAGFADPVMDQETLTLNWPDAPALLAELRQLGANVDPARHAGLRTPRWRDALCRALQPTPASRPALRFEIVYGHAFRPPPRIQASARTEVGLDDMRSILRTRRES